MVAAKSAAHPVSHGRNRRAASSQRGVGMRLIIWLSLLLNALFIVREVANTVGITTRSMFPTDDLSHYVPTDLFLHLQKGVADLLPTTTSSSGSSNSFASRAMRINKYTQSYKYTPPLPRPSRSPPAECGAPPGYDAFFQLSAEARSARNQDKLIYEYLFRDKINKDQPGTYVEVGAFDGRKGSNSRFFDDCLGWPGLLIDANPNVYQALLSQRSYAHRMNFAASCTVHQEATSPTVAFINSEEDTAGVEGRALTLGRATIPVPCGPLGDVLTDMFDDTRINFLSVSVENAEADVFQTINFKNVKMDVIVVAADPKFCRATCESRDKVRSILEAAGFHRFSDLVEGSDLYIHPDSPYQLPPGAAAASDKDTTASGNFRRGGAVTTDSSSPAVTAASAVAAITATSNGGGPLAVISRDPGRVAKYTNIYNYQAPTQPFEKTAEYCGSGPDFQGFFQIDGNKRALHLEDKILYDRYFKSALAGKPGTYVEIGAFDGIQESNTRFYDECLGWKGLLIEANTISYRKLLTRRPMAHKLQFSPSCSAEYEQQNGKVPFYQYPFTTSGLVGVSKMFEGKPLIENVPCGPLGPLLEDAFGQHHINWVSLDVEGAEHLVLETIDFKRVHIDLLMVEVQSMFCQENCESREATRDIMAKAGYIRFEGIVLQSDVYLHPEFAKGFAPEAGAAVGVNRNTLGGTANAPPQTTTTDSINGGAPKAHLTPEQALDDKRARLAKYTTQYSYFPPAGAISQAARECGAAPDFLDFFQLTPQTRSANNEDKIIYEKFFKGQMTGKGTYVEIGAFDGNHDSNSRFFDTCLAWKGLLVEGNPATYRKTLQHRPQSHGMNFAPCCAEDGKVRFYRAAVPTSGMSATVQGSVQGFEMVDVPCGPLGPVLLDVFAGERINFFSLDVEGAEALVLRTVDFSTVEIDVLMVDADEIYTSSVYETRAIMNQAGYTLHLGVVPHSDVFVHPQSPYQLKQSY